MKNIFIFRPPGQLPSKQKRSKTELSPAKKFMKFGLLGVDAVGDCSSLMSALFDNP